MTVVGFARSRDGSGLCWADTEGYSHDEPMTEPIMKLAISAGGLVGVSVGYVVLVEAFRGLVAELGRATFMVAAARLPAQLRRARDEWRAQVLGHGIDYIEQTTFAVCGFGANGFRGFVFAELAGFEASERTSWASPYVDLPVSSASDVLKFAQEQIRFVQVTSPTVTGKSLTVARLLGPGRVECVSVPLLLADEKPSGDSPAHRAARLAAIEARRRCFI